MSLGHDPSMGSQLAKLVAVGAVLVDFLNGFLVSCPKGGVGVAGGQRGHCGAPRAAAQ